MYGGGKWLTTIKQVDGGTMTVERMEPDETGFPQPWCKASTRPTRSTRHGGACPAATASRSDNAVIKLDAPVDGRDDLIDLDYCKGCGLCVAECPSGAIQMLPEQI